VSADLAGRPTGTPGGPATTTVAVAFCPCPPLLPPAVAGRAADETAALRQACREAAEAVLAVRPAVVVVVGDGVPDGVRYGPGDAGDLRGFGVDLEIPFSGAPRPVGRRLPLAHTLGAWLLAEAGHAGPRLGVGPADLPGVLREQAGPVAVLAMGDGSARRTVKAPGYVDPAAEPFDAAVAEALEKGDAGALAAFDPTEGERLLAAGVPTWRAVGAALAGRPIAARLRYDDAPYGVGYLVADWRAA
jgi:hypothetical protein